LHTHFHLPKKSLYLDHLQSNIDHHFQTIQINIDNDLQFDNNNNKNANHSENYQFAATLFTELFRPKSISVS